MRLYLNRLLSLVFCVCLAIPLYGYLLFDKDVFSKAEGRFLAAAVELPRGIGEVREYTSTFETYFNDHFGFREQLYNMHHKAHIAMGFSPIEEVKLGKDGWMFSMGYTMRNRMPFLKEERRMLQFYHRMMYELVYAGNVPYVLSVVPAKFEVYSEKLPLGYSVPPQLKRYDQVIDTLQDLDLFPVIDLKAALVSRKNPDVPLYFKNDHHWNMVGANVGQYALAQILDDFLPIDPIETPLQRFIWKKQGDTFYPRDAKFDEFITYEDSLTRMLGLGGERPDDYPVPDWLVERDYSSVGSGKLVHIRSNAETNLRALVIHDSFVRGLVPYLNTYFSDVLYLWDTTPEPSKVIDAISSFRPDIVIEQTSDNRVFSQRHSYAVAGRVSELKTLSRDWKSIYEWQGATSESWNAPKAWDLTHDDEGTFRISSRQKPLWGGGLGFLERPHLVIPKSVIAAHSGKSIRILVEHKRPAENGAGQVAFAYSAAAQGNSDWQHRLTAAEFIQSQFVFRLPEEQPLVDPIISVWGDTEGNGRGVLVRKITIQAHE